MIYNLAQPINIVFNSINDLLEYVIAAESELTQSQKINLDLVILNMQKIFKDNIWAWKCTNQAYKTWDNFKYDFREAHLELRETEGTIDEIGFHNANAIVDQVMARLQVKPTPTPNGPILTKFQIIRTVMASAVEVETG